MSTMKPGWSTSILTQIEGVPDRSSVKRGMAFYAGTGPLGMTCGDCDHLDRADRKKARCAMVKKLTGRRGEVVTPQNLACKYFVKR
jgi:hypothetical protein